MEKAHTLLLAFVILVGCSSASVRSTSPPETPLPIELPTQTQIPEPIIVESTATAIPTLQPQPSPTEPSVASPTPLIYASPLFRYPIGIAGAVPGDGFFIRHGFAVENTWYNPGYWHTGEDWYLIEGDTAGAEVYAIAGGEVVYVGGNYPGRVVIIRHTDALFSMYGHLDPQLNVQQAQQVKRGQVLGTVLRRGDETPNHLHFEIRSFLTTPDVNGSTPRYPFRCGVNCPPGPGYWPINAPDLPGDLGWRTPSHVIAERAFPSLSPEQPGQVIVATQPVSQSVTLWPAPPGDPGHQALGTLELHPGERFPLLGVRVAPEAGNATSALAYAVWYLLRLPDGQDVWVQATVPSSFETGSDGRPSSVYFTFFPLDTAS